MSKERVIDRMRWCVVWFYGIALESRKGGWKGGILFSCADERSTIRS